MLYRTSERIYAVGNRCTHQGAPLHKGVGRVIGSIASVACPLHGSTFELRDGRVLRGPATRPLQAYDVKVTDGVLVVRPRP